MNQQTKSRCTGLHVATRVTIGIGIDYSLEYGRMTKLFCQPSLARLGSIQFFIRGRRKAIRSLAIHYGYRDKGLGYQSTWAQALNQALDGTSVLSGANGQRRARRIYRVQDP